MRSSRPAFTAERVLSTAEFERMLQRAEKVQRLGRLRLIAKPHCGHKRDASAV